MKKDGVHKQSENFFCKKQQLEAEFSKKVAFSTHFDPRFCQKMKFFSHRKKAARRACRAASCSAVPLRI
jgi:hypothetical protein